MKRFERSRFHYSEEYGLQSVTMRAEFTTCRWWRVGMHFADGDTGWSWYFNLPFTVISFHYSELPDVRIYEIPMPEES